MKGRSDRLTSTQAIVVLAVLLGGITLAGAVVLSGCTATPPSESPSIRGTIMSITLPETGPGGNILVEGSKESDTQYDKASITLTGDTDIFDADGAPGLSIGDLSEGMRVEAWFSGPVAESYPVQAQAEAVRVLGSR